MASGHLEDVGGEENNNNNNNNNNNSNIDIQEVGWEGMNWSDLDQERFSWRVTEMRY
jgi:hypothetical protein